MVALSGQMMGCTPVSSDGAALRPSMLYCDQRATAQADRLIARVGLERFYAITGHRVSASYTLEKLMLAARPGARGLCAHGQNPLRKDYINCRLTGRMATDFSDASGTNAFDLNRFAWSSEVLDAAGISADMFPELLESSALLGGITASAARATGLLEGSPVAVGGGDGSCAGVGVGCVRPGTAYNYLGSSSWIALTVKEPIVDPLMRTMNWAHCVPGYLHPSGTIRPPGQPTSGSRKRSAQARLPKPRIAAAIPMSSSIGPSRAFRQARTACSFFPICWASARRGGTPKPAPRSSAQAWRRVMRIFCAPRSKASRSIWASLWNLPQARAHRAHHSDWRRRAQPRLAADSCGRLRLSGREP